MRKICVVTGTRADYGLLFWLMKEIQEDPELQLHIVATGMHLSPEFGLTYQVIEQDGFSIDAKVEMLLSSDTPVAISKSIGLGVIGFADVLGRMQPDILVLLGDRFEIFAAAQAALVAQIPIAHIHGGETTEGVIDEAIRHSLTKMAQLHFVAAEPYRKRVIQMGENPDLVFNVGAPGLDTLSQTNFLSREDLEKSIDFKLGKPTFLVTYHPVTLESLGSRLPMKELLLAFDHFPTARIIFTKPNADTNGRIISQMIDEYVGKNSIRARAYDSLGQLRYFSVLKHADAVIGNSSSGLIEAPFLKKATINLGIRQQGRLKASSVIDCTETCEEIVKAIEIGLSSDFQHSLEQVVSPYGLSNASSKIKYVLKTANLHKIILKRFHDVEN